MAHELQQFAELHASNPTPKNREAVVVAGVPLVRSLVGRLNIPDHPLASREDLENVGLLGLLQALDTYDAGRGTPFVSFAYGRIRGALIDYLRSIDALPRERRKQLGEAQHALETLRQLRGGEPEDNEVAAYLGISLSQYHALLNDAQSRFALSLHETVSSEADQAVIETIANEDAEQGHSDVDAGSMTQYVTALIRRLPEREQNILALYYFENLTLREIAQLMNLTEARISQIIGKVLATLRYRMSGGMALAA